MRVFLIHGMGRTPASMWVLDRRLRAAGYEPSLFGYFVTVRDLDEIARRFARHVERVRAQDAEDEERGWAVVSHSLGGIITRLASPLLPGAWRAFVMLAPPNRPPSLVTEVVGANRLFRLFTQDTGQKLQDEEFYAALPRPEVPTLVVAGTGGPRADKLHLSEPNDGILRLEETRLKGAPLLEIPAVHTFLMNRADVFAAVREFFAEHGMGST